ncbi:hypothetical protein [Paenibacillus herberti]|uniref:hypothetical protein n=1 Tax=Paenibacillus herberti TaxID=1619309 RepID=UPI0015954C52|nr:hypothetical protein [Paenibacillus herberti]
MIEMDESEMLESDFDDNGLRMVGSLLGPWVAQWLLLPGSVPVQLPEKIERHV